MALSVLEKHWIEEWARRVDSECRQVRDREGRSRRTRGIPIKDLAERLPSMVADFRQSHPSNQSLDAEIKACGAAYALGPSNAGAVPDTIIAVHLTPKFEAFPDERACEAVVAYGCLRPFGKNDGGSGDWDVCWQVASNTLFDMILICVRPAVEWFGARVGRMNGKNLREWAESESLATAAQIREQLLQTCLCFKRDDDFHVRDGAVRCMTEHSLAHWEVEKVAEQSLQTFVWTATIKGDLRLPDPAVGRWETAFCNDARKGMLCRCICVGDELIVAGPVLKCKQEGCNADITLSDQCTNGHGVSPSPDITYWFWKQNERGKWKCRRCGNVSATGCNGLYFQYGPDDGVDDGPDAACPHCGRMAWSRTKTEVYVRWEHLPADARRSLDNSGAIYLSPEELQKVVNSLETKEEKFLAKQLFRKHASGKQARRELAKEFHRDFSHREFAELMQRLVYAVPNILDLKLDEE